MKDINKILWFVYDFNEPGGGERWILEAERLFHNYSIETVILCKNFNKKVFFNGKYEVPIQVLLNKGIDTDSLIDKVRGFFKLIINLIKIIRGQKSQRILCQGFREIIIVYFASLFTSTKYSIIDFGQIYHFGGIKIKYSYFYKKYLKKYNSILKSFGEEPINELPPKTLLKKIENEIKGALIYLAYKKASNIFTLSERVKNEVKELYNINSCVIKCAYNESLLTPNNQVRKLKLSNKKIIFTVSRLVPNKRVDLCIKAIYFLSKINNNFIFYIGGVGSEMEKLKKMVIDLKVEEYVKFLGFIDENKLKDYYIACEVFTTMDHCDFDITSYMALALGRKVVWAKIMEIDSNLSGNKHVFPVEPTPEKIAKKYNKVLNLSIGRNSQEEISALNQYTYETAFKKLLDKMLNN